MIAWNSSSQDRRIRRLVKFDFEDSQDTGDPPAGSIAAEPGIPVDGRQAVLEAVGGQFRGTILPITGRSI